jgi:hypothetical protein
VQWTGTQGVLNEWLWAIGWEETPPFGGSIKYLLLLGCSTYFNTIWGTVKSRDIGLE